jgi:hypothetical protein
MREFFRPWRRKIGIVTLLMASVFAAGWVRSLYSNDFVFIEFEFPFGGRINIYTSPDQMDIFLQRSTGWCFDFGKVEPIRKRSLLTDVWFFDIHEIEEKIEDDVLQVAPGYKVRSFIHVIVISLTALSAFLLLTKSRHSTQQKIPEPVQSEGAAMACLR